MTYLVFLKDLAQCNNECSRNISHWRYYLLLLLQALPQISFGTVGNSLPSKPVLFWKQDWPTKWFETSEDTEGIVTMIPVLGFLYPGTSPSNRFDECSRPHDGRAVSTLGTDHVTPILGPQESSGKFIWYFLPPFRHLVDHLPWVSQWGFKLWLWILAPYSVTPELITLSSHSLIASLRQETGRHLLLLFPIEPTDSYGVYLQDSPFSPFLLPLPMCGAQVYLVNLSSSWLRMSPPVSSILTARNISSYTAVLTAPLSCPFTLPPQNTLSLASWKKKIWLDTHLTPYANINSWHIQDLND